ncbi:uncharacterized protein si:dkey-19b23.7 isoform X2 [Synchiropus splendidus]|uniref:uncharacterized protein si:dkey-19b23.7 isoform X2 n=1 Tax=Synchiropus splendidus TaxID=270530 RepID=UPI00237D34B3|nr:uncharacterized protein si:dkey-19b23.7 isoform X2 [Synchiropus splendidus]
MSSKREREQRKKLQHFLGDLALLGSLQGFKYFQPWLRGKEELLLTVVNEDLGWRSPGFMVSRASSYTSGSSSCDSSSTSPSSSSPSLGSRSSSPLPGEPSDPPASYAHSHTKTPPLTIRKPTSEEHLLPASPSEREIAVPEVNCTLFLLAGYIKYGRPHAWIRSNHERLVNIGGTDSMVKDTPMKLKSISDWQTRGALLNFLEMYVVYGNRDELHYDKVLDEVKPLRRLHVRSLLEVEQQALVKRSDQQDHLALKKT